MIAAARIECARNRDEQAVLPENQSVAGECHLNGGRTRAVRSGMEVADARHDRFGMNASHGATASSALRRALLPGLKPRAVPRSFAYATGSTAGTRTP